MRKLNLFLKSRWDLNKIKKKKFLLVDGNYNPFTKYYNKKDFNILYRRGEKINIRILIKYLKIKSFKITYFNAITKVYFRRVVWDGWSWDVQLKGVTP